MSLRERRGCAISIPDVAQMDRLRDIWAHKNGSRKTWKFLPGHSIMVANGSEGLRRRPNGTNGKLIVTENGKQTDQRLDTHET